LDKVTLEDLKGCDVLVHLAAHTGNVPYDSLTNCLRWNLIAVLELFEQARQAGIKRFIVAGSCFEYGRSGERYSKIPSDAPLEPTNTYAASKAAASIALWQWAEEHQLSLEILRVFHVFGDGELNTRFWPSLRKAALLGYNFPMTLGTQVRDFQYVEHVARVFLTRCLMSSTICKPSPSVYNLVTGRPLTLRDFASIWWSHWNASGRLIFGSRQSRADEILRYVGGQSSLKLPHFLGSLIDSSKGV